MRIVDEQTLNRFRFAPRCEFCGCRSPGQLHPHHAIVRRGMGGGSRIDVPLNLVSLCATDHAATHHGQRPLLVDLLAIIAAREGCLQNEIRAALFAIRRLPKETPLATALALIPRRI